MKKGGKILCIGLAAVFGTSAAGCGEKEPVKEEFIPEVVGIYEAEDATKNGNVQAVSPKLNGYSGTGYV